MGSAVRKAGGAVLRSTYRFTLRDVPTRRELPHVLNARGLVGCGVEVGVQEGDYSELLLDSWRGRHLISVDPWLAAPDDEYRSTDNVEQPVHERRYETTLARLARFGERSSVWRLTSAEAAERIPRATLDFVYIDARHDYESVREDLGLWHPRLRPGGLLAGHDYVEGTFAEGTFGVKRAVDEFAAEQGLAVRRTLREQWPSWMVLA
jgi:hypothetical protein